LARNGETLNSPSAQFWLLAAFLALVFMTGGASRFDVQSLVILRPLSVLACAAALLTLKRSHFQGRSLLIGGFGAMIALALLHLLPLPPALWQSLAGRQELADVDKIFGLNGVWRPLTLTPMNGMHSVASMLVPTAVFLLGVQLSRDDLYRLLPVLIALGAISGLLGLLQVIGGAESPFYFYRITNDGSAVGLFANRNHAAVLLACLLPMLAVFASNANGSADEKYSRQLFAAAIAIVLVPLILVTGSRSGLLIALFGLLSALLLYRRPAFGATATRRKVRSPIKAASALGGALVLVLGLATIFLSRAEAVTRLFDQSPGEEGRGEIWPLVIDLFWKYFPWGSGSGSFVEAFQVIEPGRILNSTYLNRAHNDWLEIAVTFGLPGILLLVFAFLSYVRRSFILWRLNDGKRRSVRFARMAGIAMAMIAIASIADYPLRTPIMMSVFAVFALWFTEPDHESDAKSRTSGDEGN
jgi:O-antigen ligase